MQHPIKFYCFNVELLTLPAVPALDSAPRRQQGEHDVWKNLGHENLSKDCEGRRQRIDASSATLLPSPPTLLFLALWRQSLLWSTINSTLSNCTV